MKLFSTKTARLLLRTFALYLALSLLLFLLPLRAVAPLRAAVLYPFAFLQDTLLDGASPVEDGAHRLATLWRAAGAARDLQEENARLRAQLAQESESRRAAELLLAQLNQLPPEVRPRAIPATVIGYDSSPLRRTARFNKGTRAGVAPNCPVLWNGAVIGRVESVDGGSCRAALIGDRDCRLAVRCARTRVRGALEGIGGGLAVVKYIDAAADLLPGDLFVTSGGDRLTPGFPAGLLVGECIEASAATGGVHKYVLLKPAFEPATLEHVTLLLPEATP